MSLADGARYALWFERREGRAVVALAQLARVGGVGKAEERDAAADAQREREADQACAGPHAPPPRAPELPLQRGEEADEVRVEQQDGARRL